MSKKTDIKTCRYAQCKHETTDIDITKEEYSISSRLYYHPDCLKIKLDSEKKDDKTKKDLQYIKNGWAEHISNTVVYSQLFVCLNNLISHGISSDYLVFVFDYVVKNKLNLRHPAGFKYFVDKQEIKDAYRKHQVAKSGVKKHSDFITTNDNENAPTFTISQKPMGFKSILGGNKK